VNLSFAKIINSSFDKKELYGKILKRTVVLLSLGLFINLFPFTPDQFHNFRIPGVLQRIALVFFFTSVIFINSSTKTQYIIIAGLLLGYWGMMILIPVPGLDGTGLEPHNNLSAYIDQLILGKHVWAHSKPWDPEGILTTLPAIASGLIGAVTANVFKHEITSSDKVIRLISFGLLLIGIGIGWSFYFPMNKNLWTSSYVCFSSGCALIVLCICYYVIDVINQPFLVKPFQILGCNAITIYVLSELIAKLFYVISYEQNLENVPLKSLIFSIFNVSFVGPYNASLLLAVLWAVGFWVIAYVMFRKKIFIKV
jgi:predicted acyltransferase